MANQLEILIQAKDNASGAMKAVSSSAAAMGQAVESASEKMESASDKASKFETAAKKIDSAGRNARIGLSSMSQAAQLVGVDLSGVIGPAAGAADAIGDIVGAVGELGMIGGIVGVAIAAFAALKFAVDQYNKSIADNIMFNDRYLQDAHLIAAGNNELAASFNALKEATVASQQLGLDDLIRVNPQLQATNAALLAIGLGIKDTNVALAEAKTQWEVMSSAATQAYNSLEQVREVSGLVAQSAHDHGNAERDRAQALEYSAAAARRLADAMGDTRGDAVKDYREGARSVAEMNTKAWLASHEFKEGAGWVAKIGENAGKASQNVSQMAQKLKGLVENALQPTAADPNMGNAWDEARKRFEAFATGTDVGAYGEEFKKMFDSLGMSAQQAADAFKNFSLFADPKNLKLVDMGPIVENVKTQLDGMIGKANLTSAAMQEVWKNLSPTQKAALAEQGISNASDAIDALIDPTAQAKTQVQQLGNAMNAIPSAITTTFTVVKDAAEQAIKDFREVLDKFIADYGNVTISINADTSANPPTSDTTPTGTDGGVGAQFARGGSFVIPQSYGYEGFRLGGIGTASGGERVTISPRGSAGGNSFTFNVAVSNDAMLNALMRKVRALAMLNAM